MKDEEILNEIKDNVSGETTQQLTQFKEMGSIRPYDPGITFLKGCTELTIHEGYRYDNDTKDVTVTLKEKKAIESAVDQLGKESYKIILNDKENNYWLILKRTITMVADLSKFTVTVDHNYYLSGFNDDGKYFITQLERMPMHVLSTALYKNDVTNVVEWMNKADMGFKRIQGDILYRIVDLGKVKKDKAEAKEHYLVSLCDHLELTLSKDDNAKNVMPDDFGDHKIKAGVGMFKAEVKIWEPNQVYEYTNKMADRYEEANDEYRIVSGASNLILEHPQHKTEELKTENKTVILTHQRGKNISRPMAD